MKGWLMTMYRVFSRMAALTSARSICQLFAARRGSVVVWHPAWSGVSAVDWYAGEKHMACVWLFKRANAAVCSATWHPQKMRMFSAPIDGP